MASLKKGHRKVIGAYLRDLADKLGLRDWTVTVMHASPQDLGEDAGYLAQVGSDPGAWEAKFYFRSDFPTLSDDQVRETCVHELVHVHRRVIRHFNDKTIKEVLSVDAWNTWLAAVTLLDETATDALARAIAPLMPPFPGWAKGKAT